MGGDGRERHACHRRRDPALRRPRGQGALRGAPLFQQGPRPGPRGGAGLPAGSVGLSPSRDSVRCRLAGRRVLLVRCEPSCALALFLFGGVSRSGARPRPRWSSPGWRSAHPFSSTRGLCSVTPGRRRSSSSPWSSSGAGGARASRRVRAYLGGRGSAGWAVISEYPVAVLAVALLLRAGSRRSWTRMASFALGAALPGAVLLAYNAACFGSPFSLSSRPHEASPEFSRLVGNGLFESRATESPRGVPVPLSTARGLVLYSPFVLWAIPGFLRWRRSGEDAPDRKFCLFGSLLFFVAMCGYPNWHGGWCLESLVTLVPPALPAGARHSAIARSARRVPGGRLPPRSAFRSASRPSPARPGRTSRWSCRGRPGPGPAGSSPAAGSRRPCRRSLRWPA